MAVDIVEVETEDTKAAAVMETVEDETGAKVLGGGRGFDDENTGERRGRTVPTHYGSVKQPAEAHMRQ